MNLQFSPKLLPTSVIFALVSGLLYLNIFLPETPSPRLVFEPPFLLPVLNGVFISIASFAVAYFSMRSYLADGLISLLFLGCGSLALGMTSLVTGWLMHIPGGPNFNITVFNSGVLLSGLLHFTGAVITTVTVSVKSDPAIRKAMLAVVYSIVAAMVLLIALLSFQGLLPRFFSPDAGPTLTRQVVLGSALLLFALSSVIFLRLYYHSRSGFFYWYSSALTLFAAGLMGVFMMRTLGDPINWIGRVSQYLGGVYLFVAVMMAVRTARRRDVALNRAFAEIFRKPWELYESLVQTATDSIVSLDEEGKVILWNPAAESMFGFSRDEATGSFFVDLVFSAKNGEDSKRLLAHFLGDSLLPAQAERFELEMKRRNGERFPAEVMYSARVISEERIGTLIVRDATERKRLERELRQSRDELELRVRERTAELEAANAKLQEYNRRLETLNKELQDFAFVASHDLQEPLRKVRTFGDILVEKCGVSLDEDSLNYLTRMQTASASMQRLLNSLLAYSRLTTKAEPLKETDLGKSAEAALSNLEVMIREANAHVEVEDLPTVMADGVQMIQLFQNLVANALKFHRDGEAPRIKLHARGGGKGTHEIYVEDNGIGFEERYLDKIFLPFQRLHGRRSDYDGVGMGLAICKKIVERHGGSITARSAPGKGSTFIVTLPAE